MPAFSRAVAAYLAGPPSVGALSVGAPLGVQLRREIVDEGLIRCHAGWPAPLLEVACDSGLQPRLQRERVVRAPIEAGVPLDSGDQDGELVGLCGIAVWNRKYSPTCCKRSPSTGLRSHALNDPSMEWRGPAMIASYMAFCIRPAAGADANL